MAGELQYCNVAFTGSTLYALLFNASGQVWDDTDGGGQFETFVDADIGQYDIAMTEQGTASGYFIATMPSVSGGVYTFSVRDQAGGSPAVSDSDIASGVIQWDGSAELELYELPVDIKKISGDSTAANNAELAFDGTGYGFTGCTMPTVTTLTGHTAQTGDTYGELPTNFSDLSITVTTGRVDVASVEGSDATDQIRDAVVDDATRIDASALNALTGVSNIASLTIDASGHVEADVVETNGNANIESTYDLTEVLRIILAAVAGKSTGGGTTSVNFRDVADGKNRIAATVDANGNRTAITLDAS